MAEPREKTREEIRAEFLRHIWNMVRYWDELGPDPLGKFPERTQRDRLAGLAFSILATIDGCSPEVTGFLMIPNPHPSDKQFLWNTGENWYPEAKGGVGGCCDIGGGLHEVFQEFDPNKAKEKVSG